MTYKCKRKHKNKKFLFNCPKCKHDFDTALNNAARVKPPQTGCRYCTGKEFCNDEKCLPCHNDSFASHEKSKFWSSENKW